MVVIGRIMAGHATCPLDNDPRRGAIKTLNATRASSIVTGLVLIFSKWEKRTFNKKLKGLE